MMDIIERLWIAHGELPGRQLLMRDAIQEIQTLRDERDARISIELLNIERETGDRLRADNAKLRKELNAAGAENIWLQKKVEIVTDEMVRLARELDKIMNDAAAGRDIDAQTQALLSANKGLAEERDRLLLVLSAPPSKKEGE